jgi:hypothetical protein
MRATATITLAAFLNLFAVTARAQNADAECTTTTTTTVTCKGSAAPLAVPAPEQPQAPVAAPPQAPVYPYPRLDYEVPRLYMPPMKSHVEEKPRYGLIIAGATIFGASWLLNVSIAYLAQEGTFAVPVIGPIIWGANNLNKSQSGCGDCSIDNAGDRMAMTMLVFDSLVQATGIALLIAGAVTRKKVTVWDNVALLPTAGPSGAGLAAMGTF